MVRPIMLGWPSPGKRDLVMLPQLALRGHEAEEAGILAQGIQLGSVFKERIAWESILSRVFQPIHGLLWPVEPGIGKGQQVGGVMKVGVGLDDLSALSGSDTSFCLACLARLRQS